MYVCHNVIPLLSDDHHCIRHDYSDDTRLGCDVNSDVSGTALRVINREMLRGMTRQES